MVTATGMAAMTAGPKITILLTTRSLTTGNRIQRHNQDLLAMALVMHREMVLAVHQEMVRPKWLVTDKKAIRPSVKYLLSIQRNLKVNQINRIMIQSPKITILMTMRSKISRNKVKTSSLQNQGNINRARQCRINIESHT